MTSDANVTLWVKAEPFSYGAFPTAPHPRLTLNVCTVNSLLLFKVCNQWLGIRGS